jgi:hypothetical protein
MGIKDGIQSIWSNPNRGKLSSFKNRLFPKSETKNWLRESGVVDTNSNWTWSFVDKEFADKKYKMIEHQFNFATYHRCYERIPKVFRSINIRANFAIQSGFKLSGDKADVDRINAWRQKVNYDMHLLTWAKLCYIDGNVYLDVRNEGENLELQVMPPETIKVLREPNGKIHGHCQIIDGKINKIWTVEDGKMIHIKWNSLGISPYGFSEIRPNLGVLTDKLDAESVLPEIIKFHADNRIVFLLGTPERPYNKIQQEEWKSGLQERQVAGDLICGGDVKPVVIQPQRGVGDIISLIDHIENQVNTGLNNPEILIEGRSDSQGSMIQMESLERDVKTMQDVLAQIHTNYIWPLILKKKDKIPITIWNPMSQETELRMSRTIRQLIGDGKAPPVIDVNEARDKLGYSPKELESDAMKMAKSISAGGDQTAKDKKPGDKDGTGRPP